MHRHWCRETLIFVFNGPSPGGAVMRLVFAIWIMAMGLAYASGEAKLPKADEKNLNQPVRVPVIRCTQVCDQPLGSPNTGDPNTWKAICEMKCVENPDTRSR